MQEELANEINFQLDLAREDRALTDDERLLRQFLKVRLLALAAVDRMRWKQRSRLLWIKVGDANTKLFHLRANGRRRRKNHVPSLLNQNGVEETDQAKKASILHSHYTDLLGKSFSRNLTLKWADLNLNRANLDHLESAFTLDELK
jgi:hypothetical protein